MLNKPKKTAKERDEETLAKREHQAKQLRNRIEMAEARERGSLKKQRRTKRARALFFVGLCVDAESKDFGDERHKSTLKTIHQYVHKNSKYLFKWNARLTEWTNSQLFSRGVLLGRHAEQFLTVEDFADLWQRARTRCTTKPADAELFNLPPADAADDTNRR